MTDTVIQFHLQRGRLLGHAQNCAIPPVGSIIHIDIATYRVVDIIYTLQNAGDRCGQYMEVKVLLIRFNKLTLRTL